MSVKQSCSKGLPGVFGNALRGLGCVLVASILYVFAVSSPMIALFAAQAVSDLAIFVVGRFGRRAHSPSVRSSFVKSEFSSIIRESWLRLPGCLQPTLTQISGKPHANEKPRNSNPYVLLGKILTKLMAGIGFSALAVTGAPWCWLFVVPGWILTSSAIRELALTVIHETAGHGELFTRNKSVDRLIGETAAVLCLSQNYDAYGPEHKLDHHGSNFMTSEDPTIRFLERVLGITRGMHRLEAWIRLIAALISPLYQFSQTSRRIRSSWEGASRFHKCSLVIHLAIVIGIGFFFPNIVLVVWIIPVLAVVNMAIAVRMCLEHTYPPSSVVRLKSAEGVHGSTHAIFFGSMAPSPNLPLIVRILAWALWAVHMVCVVVPSKLLLAPGASAAHDYHHARPLAGVSPDPIFARQVWLETRSVDAPQPTEVWGAFAAVDDLFVSLSESRAY